MSELMEETFEILSDPEMVNAIKEEQRTSRRGELTSFALF